MLFTRIYYLFILSIYHAKYVTAIKPTARHTMRRITDLTYFEGIFSVTQLNWHARRYKSKQQVEKCYLYIFIHIYKLQYNLCQRHETSRKWNANAVEFNIKNHD